MKTAHKLIGERAGKDHNREMGYWQAIEELSDEELIADMINERQRLLRPDRPENYYHTELALRGICLAVLGENLRRQRHLIANQPWGYVEE